MVLSGSRSLLARYGVKRDRATITVGLMMILQFIPAYIFAKAVNFYALSLSYGVAFCGLMDCMAVIVPKLRALREMPHWSANGANLKNQRDHSLSQGWKGTCNRCLCARTEMTPAESRAHVATATAI